MRIIDTHCHLYLEEFASDIDSLIKSAKEKGIGSIYLPAIDSETTNALLALESKYPDTCHAMMGLHPCSVKSNYREELNLVGDWLSKRKFAGIGEAGLDFYWDKTYMSEQYEALRTQMEWAIQYDLPIILHTRNAIPETIEAVKPYAAKGLRGIFHCFGGSLSEARSIIDMGFFLGIGGVLTYKKSGLQEVLSDIPLEWLVLETDAPYLTPVPFRGKRNQPDYIVYVLNTLAELKGMQVEEVALMTSTNAEKVFSV